MFAYYVDTELAEVLCSLDRNYATEDICLQSP